MWSMYDRFILKNASLSGEWSMTVCIAVSFPKCLVRVFPKGLVRDMGIEFSYWRCVARFCCEFLFERSEWIYFIQIALHLYAIVYRVIQLRYVMILMRYRPFHCDLTQWLSDNKNIQTLHSRGLKVSRRPTIIMLTISTPSNLLLI